jgi:hypothetical protein
MSDGASQLGPIDWWVWHRRNLSLLVTVNAVTRTRAMLEGVSKIKGANGVWDVDAEVVREGDTREKWLARAQSKLKKGKAA